MAFNKTILQVIPSMEEGGAERTTVEVTRAIVDAGGRAVVATNRGRLCPEIEAAGGRIFKMPVHKKNPLTVAANIGGLQTLIRDEAVDLIHARSRAPAWSAFAAARRTGIPFVTTYHGAYRGQSAVKRFINSAMVRGDRVIANSEFTAQSVAATYRGVTDRLRVIPRGADVDAFNPGQVSRERKQILLNAWGLSRKRDDDNHNCLFIMPARLTEWKGHGLVIQALGRLIDSNFSKMSGLARSSTGQALNLTVAFIGDVGAAPDYVCQLQKQIDELGVGNMTVFVGHCGDMPAAYGVADAVLSPSLRPEAFGRVAVEAGAMEKPVIVAEHGGACETVLPTKTGFHITPGDVGNLAEMMMRIVAMKADERRIMGMAARRYVSENFTTAAMTRATLDVYGELLNSEPRMSV